MEFKIKSKYSEKVIFTAEIPVDVDTPFSIQLGLAVKVAIGAGESLSRANLSHANLSGVDLSDVDLSGVDLSDANLSDTNLSYANLSDTNLSYANLSYANLSDTNLSYANLSHANLSRANLFGADLSGANPSGANLSGVDLSRTKGGDVIIARTRILPEGSLIGWKKLKNGIIAKLRIPENAKRSHAFGRKCRAEYVEVIEGEGVSILDGKTKYAPGLIVQCHKWSENWQEECAGGIHFYITREEAENH